MEAGATCRLGNTICRSRYGRDEIGERAIAMIEVIKAGLETCVQDFPGRYGFWEQGFPRRPDPSTCGRFASPTCWSATRRRRRGWRYSSSARRCASSLTPRSRSRAPPWPQSSTAPRSRSGRASPPPPARCWKPASPAIGARAYLAVAGGIETAPVLGSRSTFHMAGVGGMEGHAIEDGQHLPLGAWR